MKKTHSISYWPLTEDGQFADTEPAYTTARQPLRIAEQMFQNVEKAVCRTLTGVDAPRYNVCLDEHGQDGHPVCVEIRTI